MQRFYAMKVEENFNCFCHLGPPWESMSNRNLFPKKKAPADLQHLFSSPTKANSSSTKTGPLLNLLLPAQSPSISPTNALMAPPPKQALPPSLETTDNGGTWLSSGFDVGIIILLICIFIIVVIVLCLQCRLFYRTSQQCAPSDASPCQNPAASSPRTPSASVPLPTPTSVPMPSSSFADHSAPSPIPLQTFSTTL
ncbi:hypothetical protein niasHT_018908 [Heterodera trifolii]|uniref:Uncharacterized protein n=1 Tax=Heterodera trifolii TaxID=157864 RepID=A0ABD2LDS2_9BILA